MRTFNVTAFLAVAASLFSPALAAEETIEIQIHLITIGEGDHIYTAGGHSSLMVAKIKDGRPDPSQTLVYNYGDTDWEDPDFVSKFFGGEVNFFLSTTSTLQATVNNYGMRQKREIWRQRVNVTQEQARNIAEHLAKEVLPENRNYVYHHTNATCTTKIRDVLDLYIGGEIKAQLSKPDIMTVRDYQHVLLRKHSGVALAAELFLGRIHDQPMDKYSGMFDPNRLAKYLQEVKISGPEGNGELVPLLEPQVPLVESQQEVTYNKTIFPTAVAVLVMIFLLLMGFSAYRNLPGKTRRAGVWLTVSSLIFGSVGMIIVLFFIFTKIPEIRYNENIFAFLPTDLLLLYPAMVWLRGKAISKRLTTILKYYSIARLALVSLAIIAHLISLLYQQPFIFTLVSLTFSVWLFFISRRMASVA